ncbi:MAG: sugar phosphate isomerase/epimerase [Eubacteriales bacterium]|nr:sugar phosphate isomerase/epimerase [Eubacteriales bacterium]
MIKIGGHVFPEKEEDAKDPEKLARLAKNMGYTAAYAPAYLTIDQPDEVRRARKAFEKEGILLAEVGYWQNMLDTREDVRRKNRDEMKKTFQLAEELGAGCVVNTAGSYCEGEGYTNHNPRNFSEEHFQDAVEMARWFIDEVQPHKAYFTYEVFMYNSIDCPAQYARLVKEVDRKMFGVHLDLTNMMRSPRELYQGKEIVEQCVRLFPDKIVSSHIKDARLKRPAITTMIEEAIPGQGEVNLTPYLKELARLPQTVTVMMEHFKNEAEYLQGLTYIKWLAKKAGIMTVGS